MKTDMMCYYTKFCRNPKEPDIDNMAIRYICVDQETCTEIMEVLNYLKNKKPPGIGEIYLELLKYKSHQIKYRFLGILNI
jgi:hypothetical protein